jgi:hypothetical protein
MRFLMIICTFLAGVFLLMGSLLLLNKTEPWQSSDYILLTVLALYSAGFTKGLSEINGQDSSKK